MATDKKQLYKGVNPIQFNPVIETLDSIDESNAAPINSKAFKSGVANLPVEETVNNSTNPVSSIAVKNAITTVSDKITQIEESVENLQSSDIVVDSALNTESVNPVQNKVVTNKFTEIENLVSNINGVEVYTINFNGDNIPDYNTALAMLNRGVKLYIKNKFEYPCLCTCYKNIEEGNLYLYADEDPASMTYLSVYITNQGTKRVSYYDRFVNKIQNANKMAVTSGAVYTKVQELQTAINNLSTVGITVDSELNNTSENPVQNKVINSKITEIENKNKAAIIEITKFDETTGYITEATADYNAIATAIRDNVPIIVHSSKTNIDDSVDDYKIRVIETKINTYGGYNYIEVLARDYDISNKLYIFDISTGGVSVRSKNIISIDDALNNSSTNPVQNKIISAKFTEIENNVNGIYNPVVIEFAGDENTGNITSVTADYNTVLDAIRNNKPIMAYAENTLDGISAIYKTPVIDKMIIPTVNDSETIDMAVLTIYYANNDKQHYNIYITPDYIEAVPVDAIDVDEAFLDNSTRPVQNKIIKAKFTEIENRINNLSTGSDGSETIKFEATNAFPNISSSTNIDTVITFDKDSDFVYKKYNVYGYYKENNLTQLMHGNVIYSKYETSIFVTIDLFVHDSNETSKHIVRNQLGIMNASTKVITWDAKTTPANG